jgi:hypothetical protein
MPVKATTYALAGRHLIRPDSIAILEINDSLVGIAGAVVQPVVDLSSKPLVQAKLGGSLKVARDDPVKIWLTGLTEADKERDTIFFEPEVAVAIEQSNVERDGLECLLREFGSTKGMLEEIQSLRRTIAILKTREERFKQDPLLRRRRLESCDHALLRVLVVGLQNELLAATTLIDSWNLAKEPTFLPPRRPQPVPRNQPREMNISELLKGCASCHEQGATEELSRSFAHDQQAALISELQQENQELKRQASRQARTQKLMLLSMRHLGSSGQDPSSGHIGGGGMHSDKQGPSPTSQRAINSRAINSRASSTRAINSRASSPSARSFSDPRGHVRRRPRLADPSFLGSTSGGGGGGGGGGGDGDGDGGKAGGVVEELEALLKKVVCELVEGQDALRRQEGAMNVQAAIERKQVP